MEQNSQKEILNLIRLAARYGLKGEEIAELDFFNSDLNKSREFLNKYNDLSGRYPNLLKFFRAFNEIFDQLIHEKLVSKKDKYKISEIEDFTNFAEKCCGFEEAVKVVNEKNLSAFTISFLLIKGGASFDRGDIGVLSDIEEESEVEPLPPIAVPFVKESCGKPRCPAYKAEPTKPDGFSFLTPALAAEEARRERNDYKLSKDALSNHTNKVEVVRRNLGTYHARATRMQAVQEIDNRRK